MTLDLVPFVVVALSLTGSLCLALGWLLGSLWATRERRRRIETPTSAAPCISREAERIERGELDEDFAALAALAFTRPTRRLYRRLDRQS